MTDRDSPSVEKICVVLTDIDGMFRSLKLETQDELLDLIEDWQSWGIRSKTGATPFSAICNALEEWLNGG
jgi:hypothetical protein